MPLQELFTLVLQLAMTRATRHMNEETYYVYYISNAGQFRILDVVDTRMHVTVLYVQHSIFGTVYFVKDTCR